MLEGAILSYLSAFSRTYILKTLSKLEYGDLQIVMKDQGQETSQTFGSKSKDPNMPSATLVINNSNAWTRMSINLDLVSSTCI
jgi:cyclopropane-fatty-acyl-phospholipid synthase